MRQAFRREQQAFLELGNPAFLPDGFERGGHQGERPFFPMFPLAQPENSGFIASIHDKLEPAQSLQGENAPRANDLRALRQCGVTPGAQAAGGIQQPKARAAIGTSVRLGVEPSIFRIVVLAFAPRTHRETLHRGIATVVRQALDD